MSEQRVVVVDSTSYTFTTAYGGHDNAGKPGYMQYPGGPDGSLGEVVQYGYDENAALESLIGDSTYVSSIHYDYMGRITQLVRGAAVLTTDYSYYPWDTKGGRLQSLETSNSTSTLQDLVYNYDQVGNIKAIGDIVAGETLSYTYDTLNRLIGFYINAALTEAYSFDSQGRLSSKGGETYAYGDSSHVHAATAMGDNSYTYDANGNMVIRSLVSGTVTGIYTLTHNAENRLVGVIGPDSTTTYTYNGDLAQVIAVMEGSQFVTKTIYIGSYYEYQIVETLTSTVATTRTYYFAGSTRVAMRDNGTLIYLLSDHLGSTSLTTDASGGVLSVQKYMPYGEVRGVGGLDTDYTYTGQRTAAAGLMYYNARHYDPALSHFIEADTIIPESVQGVQAWHRYAYVNYSPVNFNDPTGHVAWFVTGAIGATVGAVVGAVTYSISNQDTFNNGEFWTAAGAGAIAGGLIGSGVGLLAAATTGSTMATAATMMVGGGTGGAGSGLGYIVSNDEAFDSTAFVQNTAVGGAVGSISSVKPLSNLGVTIKTATHIAGAETLYALQTESWTVSGAQNAAISGAVGALFDVGGSSLLPKSTSTLSSIYPDKKFSLNVQQDILNQASRARIGEGVTYGLTSFFAGVGATYTTLSVGGIE